MSFKITAQNAILVTSLYISIMQESGFKVRTCMPTKRSMNSCSKGGMDSILRSAKFTHKKIHGIRGNQQITSPQHCKEYLRLLPVTH